MERITAEHPLSQSADILGDNIEKLKQLFPQVFTEGKIDFEALRDALGDQVESDPEYYRFTWPGKAMAKAEARKPSRGTLRPALQESVNWDSTENLYIEGDNLEVLKLLQKSYAGKVKLIYIDPPYNTGKDFVYKDNYKDNLGSYNDRYNKLDQEGKLKSSLSEINQEGSARYHSNWLNMMYPRLTLARTLLKENGSIFISIDDNELENLRKLCNEIFGESNFIASIIWRKKYGLQNDAKYFSISHEYLLCFAKCKENFKPNLVDRTDEQDNRYKNPDSDPRGNWKPADLSVGRITEKDRYPITTPTGRIVTPPEGRSWVFSKEKLKELIADNRIWFGESGNNVPSVKKFLTEVKQGLTPSTFWDYNEVGHTDGSNKALKALFENKSYFDYPKPVDFIKKAITIGSENEDVILDFFSGSGTTAHSVLELNALKSESKRKYILVQLPERIPEKNAAYSSGYKNLAEIGRERIRLSGKKIIEDNPLLNGKLDIGFKVFKLDESNIKTWETDPEKLDYNLLTEDVIKGDRSEHDVIYEILLKYGLDLTLPIQEKKIGQQTLYSIGGGALFACLSNKITPATAQEMINWSEELDAVNPQVIFKDSGFENSQDKVNTLQLLKNNDITDVWSI